MKKAVQFLPPKGGVPRKVPGERPEGIPHTNSLIDSPNRNAAFRRQRRWKRRPNFCRLKAAFHGKFTRAVGQRADERLVARHNLAEGIAVAGQAFADQCGIILRRGGHYAGCHHIVASVAEKRAEVTGNFKPPTCGRRACRQGLMTESGCRSNSLRGLTVKTAAWARLNVAQAAAAMWPSPSPRDGGAGRGVAPCRPSHRLLCKPLLICEPTKAATAADRANWLQRE